MVAAFLVIATVFVWNRHYILTLEQRIARELAKKKILLKEQVKLSVDMKKKKSPERIAMIAREKLQMTYPKKEQVILMKNPESIK